MHLYFFVRGVYHQVEFFKTFAQCQFWQWKRKNLITKKDEVCLVQGAFRPSVMGAYEYVFPEESLAELLAIMGIGRLVDAETGFIPQARLAVLRKIFGCKKISKEIIEKAKKIAPTITLSNSTRGLDHLMVPGVSIHFIGIKEDIRKDMIFSDDLQYHQEAL